MPKVKDIFSKLNGAKYFSTLDLQAGYHHIPLDKSSLPKWCSFYHLASVNMSNYLLDSHKLQHTSQELMTGILNDFNFSIAYLDNIIIFSTTVEEHLSCIKQVLRSMHCKTLNDVQQMSFLYEGNTIPRTHPQHQGHSTILIKNPSHSELASIQNAQTSSCLSWFSRILQKIYQELC